MRPISHGWLPVLLVTGMTGLAVAHSNGPLVSHTGAPAIGNKPAENTCALRGCHAGNPINTNGAVEVLGLPASYLAGNTYPITIQLSSSATANFGGRRWGFEVTALADATGDGAGVFDAPGLRLVSGFGLWGSRRYVTHNLQTIQAGEFSPARWEFAWTAPEEGVGSVTFYVAANAANGSGNTAGDFIYTAAVQTKDAKAPVTAATWGSIKARWRASELD